MTLRPDSMPVIGSVVACLFWFIDSAVDTFIFQTNRLYLEDLLAPDVPELWMRVQIVLLLMAFSLLSMSMLSRHQRVRKKLKKYKTEFENIVDQRTVDMSLTNTQLREEILERQKIEEKLIQLATIDPLTSIPNRRKFDEVLEYEMNRDSRYKNELSLIFCDLDYFKKINDKYGHKIGDDALKAFTQLVSDNIRKTDVIARWGGEEFALLLPETSIMVAASAAEKLRSETERFDFPHVGHITASFGVTQYIEGDTEASLINRADDALYKAKKNGRNRIEMLPPVKTIKFACSEKRSEEKA
ncbi:MAG: diguanylate cyclase [Gammaproteobacteria bacterium]|nr:diguanylate cyclase [Gammaproteobacteria bacterium]NNJ50372.1 diguanylate cyclase [Gammaproteobacteria bacterium]